MNLIVFLLLAWLVEIDTSISSLLDLALLKNLIPTYTEKKKNQWDKISKVRLAFPLHYSSAAHWPHIQSCIMTFVGL